MGFAGCADIIKPLPERGDIGRALAIDEKLRLIQTAKAKPEWGNARLALTLALNTTMRGCEIKGLQWRDLNPLERTLTIRHRKTQAGGRANSAQYRPSGVLLPISRKVVVR